MLAQSEANSMLIHPDRYKVKRGMLISVRFMPGSEEFQCRLTRLPPVT